MDERVERRPRSAERLVTKATAAEVGLARVERVDGGAVECSGDDSDGGGGFDKR